MTDRTKIGVENVGYSCYYADGFLNSVIALATHWAPSLQNWSLEKSKEFFRIWDEK